MFKYLVVTYDISQKGDKGLEDMLNEKAEENWELYFVAGGDLTQARFIFRKKQ
mgnify:CR=1 FL=1